MSRGAYRPADAGPAMAGGGRINREAEAKRRTGGAHFFGHEVSCARSRAAVGKKVRNAGFMRPPFAIGPSSRSRRMGVPSAI